MQQYHDFLQYILDYGVIKGDRTGTGTIGAIVPPAMRFDLSKGFPIVTTKEVNVEAVKYELKWFTNGDTNIKYLLDNGVNIWNGDTYRWYAEKGGHLSKKDFIRNAKAFPAFIQKHGELGPIYGKQWRSWDIGDGDSIDQLVTLIKQIKEVKNGNFKDARRLIVSAWNVGKLKKMALPPCHILFQFFVVNGKLSCHLYQRSGDAFLGIPFNISSYSFLVHIIAAITGLEVGEFIHTVGDAHIYLNHLDQVKEQLKREHLPLPKLLRAKRPFDINTWEPSDFILKNYQHHPAIKGDLSV